MKTAVRLILIVLLIGTMCSLVACNSSNKITKDYQAIAAAKNSSLTNSYILEGVGFAQGYKPDYTYSTETAVLEKDKDGVEKWSVTFTGTISGYKNRADYHKYDELEKKHFRFTADVYKDGVVKNHKVVESW